MDAMTSGPLQAELIGARGGVVSARPRRFSQLWQLPLLLISLALFGYAAYRFIDATPGLTIGEKINIGRDYAKHDRPEAAIEHFNKLLASERMEGATEATVHFLIAEAIEQAQIQKHRRVPRIP